MSFMVSIVNRVGSCPSARILPSRGRLGDPRWQSQVHWLISVLMINCQKHSDDVPALLHANRLNDLQRPVASSLSVTPGTSPQEMAERPPFFPKQ